MRWGVSSSSEETTGLIIIIQEIQISLILRTWSLPWDTEISVCPTKNNISHGNNHSHPAWHSAQVLHLKDNFRIKRWSVLCSAVRSVICKQLPGEYCDSLLVISLWLNKSVCEIIVAKKLQFYICKFWSDRFLHHRISLPTEISEDKDCSGVWQGQTLSLPGACLVVVGVMIWWFPVISDQYSHMVGLYYISQPVKVQLYYSHRGEGWGDK